MPSSRKPVVVVRREPEDPNARVVLVLTPAQYRALLDGVNLASASAEDAYRRGQHGEGRVLDAFEAVVPALNAARFEWPSSGRTVLEELTHHVDPAVSAYARQALHRVQDAEREAMAEVEAKRGVSLSAALSEAVGHG